MDVTGKLVNKLELETGISKSGKEWKKQSIVIDTGNDFNNLIAVSAFGDKVERMNKLEIGMEVTVLCNVYSREYNGKYYHNIDGYHFSNQSNKSKESKSLDTHFEGTTPDDLPF